MSRIRLKAATPYAFTIAIMGVLGIAQHTSQAAAEGPQYVTPDYPIDGWQNIKQGFSQAWRNTREGASTAWQQVQQGAQDASQRTRQTWQQTERSAGNDPATHRAEDTGDRSKDDAN